MKLLILYGSLEGQTQKIAEYMADVINNKGHEVTPLSAEKVPDSLSPKEFDAVMIGGSIHMGEYPKCIKQFVTTHLEWLNSTPSAFFTVCMGIRSEQEKSREEAIHFGEHFMEKTGWHPKLNETFAGAVKYTQYNFITRLIMKWISKHEGGSTDTSRDHEYTDWHSVERFAERFVTEITEQAAA